ncbi:hypothetical protein RRG08_027094 [Elysia crispata]|uniref:Uncharacterized protein n=1 Tax=Elysia crispata TaxID=231223 RepID=A0AAE0YSV5_9GAST|nr:hypothetical protein RRG08_027094 [Elysia crispata]
MTGNDFGVSLERAAPNETTNHGCGIELSLACALSRDHLTRLPRPIIRGAVCRKLPQRIILYTLSTAREEGVD